MTDLYLKKKTLFQDAYIKEEPWSRRCASSLDDESDEEYSVNNRINKIEYKVGTLIFFF